MTVRKGDMNSNDEPQMCVCKETYATNVSHDCPGPQEWVVVMCPEISDRPIMHKTARRDGDHLVLTLNERGVQHFKLLFASN